MVSAPVSTTRSSFRFHLSSDVEVLANAKSLDPITKEYIKWHAALRQSGTSGCVVSYSLRLSASMVSDADRFVDEDSLRRQYPESTLPAKRPPTQLRPRDVVRTLEVHVNSEQDTAVSVVLANAATSNDDFCMTLQVNVLHPSETAASNATQLKLLARIFPRFSVEVDEKPLYRLPWELSSMVGMGFLRQPKAALTHVMHYIHSKRLLQGRVVCCDDSLRFVLGVPFVPLASVWRVLFDTMSPVANECVDVSIALDSTSGGTATRKIDLVVSRDASGGIFPSRWQASPSSPSFSFPNYPRNNNNSLLSLNQIEPKITLKRAASLPLGMAMQRPAKCCK